MLMCLPFKGLREKKYKNWRNKIDNDHRFVSKEGRMNIFYQSVGFNAFTSNDICISEINRNHQNKCLKKDALDILL